MSIVEKQKDALHGTWPANLKTAKFILRLKICLQPFTEMCGIGWLVSSYHLMHKLQSLNLKPNPNISSKKKSNTRWSSIFIPLNLSELISYLPILHASHINGKHRKSRIMKHDPFYKFRLLVCKWYGLRKKMVLELQQWGLTAITMTTTKPYPTRFNSH